MPKQIIEECNCGQPIVIDHCTECDAPLCSDCCCTTKHDGQGETVCESCQMELEKQDDDQ